MVSSRHGRAMAQVVIVALCFVVGACSGGNGGGSGGNMALASITVEGVADPLFDNGSGPTICPSVPWVNARLVFDFGSPVDAGSLPADGAAVGGSITIVSSFAGTPAIGTWQVDASDPTRVVFDAASPVGTNVCLGGLPPGQTYVITVEEGGITLNGTPLAAGATTCFSVMGCEIGDAAASLFDRIPGPPTVVDTTPDLDATNPPTTRADLADASGPGSRIVLEFDQNLLPGSVVPESFLLANTSANAQNAIPIAVSVFLEQGTASTPTRVTLTTAQPLNDGDVHELTLVGIRDFDDQPLATSTIGLTIADENDDTPVTFIEDFTTTNRRESTEGAIRWDGDGAAVATGLVGVVGNGLDGSGIFNTNMTINTDLVLTPGDPNAAPGVFNFTDVQITANLNFTSTTDFDPGESNYPAAIRSLTTIDINPVAGAVRLDGSGRRGMDSFSIDATTTRRFGGWGGPGGGNGGDGSPVVGGMSPAGDDGQGCKVGGQPNTDPASSGFGGGGGGAAGDNVTFIDGPGGGAGGSASSFAGYQSGDPPTFTFRMATSGEPHLGTDGNGTGAPPAGAVAATPPAKMIPPLVEVVGGSGGGGGGDRIVRSGGMISIQNPGAAGGGGGGGISLTATGDINLADGTIIDCSGGDGGRAIGFFIGGGAGGSGGSIVMQCFGSVGLGLGCEFNADGGIGNDGLTSNPTMLNGEGGDGGSGVIQIEDGDGTPVSEFTNNAIFVFGELFAQPFALSGSVPGLARSITIDTQGTPTFQQASFTTLAATLAGSANVRLIGVAESPDAPGTPASQMADGSGRPLMVGPVEVQNASLLDGYRYFIFLVEVDSTELPSSATDTYPGVDSLTVQYIR